MREGWHADEFLECQTSVGFWCGLVLSFFLVLCVMSGLWVLWFVLVFGLVLSSSLLFGACPDFLMSFTELR
jgi:hypothetical protein